MTEQKSFSGRYFEDFQPNQVIHHAGALTATEGMAALYRVLSGIRFPVQCAEPFARALGYRDSPLDDVLVFKIAFGQTVADISMRAVATLGYGGCVFGEPVYPGDTIQSETEIISLEPGPTNDVGLVRVHTTGRNQHGAMVVSYYRWVTVRRRKPATVTAVLSADSLPPPVSAEQIQGLDGLSMRNYDTRVSGSQHLWEDYEVGERIDHVVGCTIEESEAMTAARLYQNVAPPHYDAHFMSATPLERRIAFVGHIVGLTRALSYNGLGNVFRMASIDRARHLQHTFPGATIYAWTEVVEKLAIPGSTDIGALRLRSTATKNQPCGDFPPAPAAGQPGDVLLELDYIGLIPRRTTKA